MPLYVQWISKTINIPQQQNALNTDLKPYRHVNIYAYVCKVLSAKRKSTLNIEVCMTLFISMCILGIKCLNSSRMSKHHCFYFNTLLSCSNLSNLLLLYIVYKRFCKKKKRIFVVKRFNLRVTHLIFLTLFFLTF